MPSMMTPLDTVKHILRDNYASDDAKSEPVETRVFISHDSDGMALNERLRVRFAEEKIKRGLTERALAERLNCSQSQVSYKLSGRTEFSVNDFEAYADALGLTLTECVRHHGLEWFMEMTTRQFRHMQAYNALKPAEQDAIDVLIRAHEGEQRGATARKSRAPRPRSGHG